MKNNNPSKPAHRVPGLRSELLSLIQKAEQKVRARLKDEPSVLQEVLRAFEGVRKTVDLLLANPRTLIRLTQDLTVHLSGYCDGELQIARETFVGLLLGMARDIRSETEAILEDRRLHFD